MVMLTRAACRCACVLTRIVLVEKRVDGCPECRCLHFDFDRLIVGAHVGHHVRGPSVGGVRRPLGRPLGWVASLIRTLATMNLEISWADMPGAPSRLAMLLMMVRQGSASPANTSFRRSKARRPDLHAAISSGYPDSEFSASEAERGAGEERDGCQTYVLLTHVPAAAV